MIYVTVGTQLPFSRLIKAINTWAEQHKMEVFAQVGPDKAHYNSIKTADFISPSEADERIRTADLVVAHAGMGSIITACQYGRPIIIMPREFRLGEHRNDHQLATARRFGDFPNITVVENEASLYQALNDFLSSDSSGSFSATSEYAPEEFINALKDLLT